MPKTQPPRSPFKALLLILAFSLLAGCTGEGKTEEKFPFSMASLEQMPEDVRSAPVTVQEAYQFAFANPTILSQIPCYCGCGAMGHASNYACYVAEASSDGTIIYDNHALGCSICVDITQDTMRLLGEGKSTAEIKAAIDQTYSKYGPSNMP
jgi:hypothetical protein